MTDLLPPEHCFAGLRRNGYGAIYADPPWRWRSYDKRETIKRRHSGELHYRTMDKVELMRLPVADLAAKDCALFLWGTWPMLVEILAIIEGWGFEYKTAAFDWCKADVSQIDMFRDDADGQMGMGFWTRSNTEYCLLATRGKPKRLDAGVRMAIVEPKREHSRKPDGIRQRVQRLVGGPYIELFSRVRTPEWDVWGNEVDRFRHPLDHGAVEAVSSP